MNTQLMPVSFHGDCVYSLTLLYSYQLGNRWKPCPEAGLFSGLSPARWLTVQAYKEYRMHNSLDDAKEIHLDQFYKANVTISANGHSFAGSILLTPLDITLTIRGEQNESRSHDFQGLCFPSLSCTSFRREIRLFDVKMKSASEVVLGRAPVVSYFEYTFAASYAIVAGGNYENEFNYIKIFSQDISKWVGLTKTQHEIMARVSSEEFKFGEGDYEFIADAETKFSTIKYNITIGGWIEDFRVGAVFPPSLDFGYQGYLMGEHVLNEVRQATDFLDVMNGSDTRIARIELFNNDHSRYPCHVYFPAGVGEDPARYSYSLFPLSRNTGIFERGLPPITDEAIVNYLNLQDDAQSKWHKYVKYRKMANNEERFLGYFRLLESLVFQEKNYFDETKLTEILTRSTGYLSRKFNANKKQIRDFATRVERLNKTKYNTEACIRKFMETLPLQLTQKWRFKKTDLTAICKLRNDITHANYYFETDEDMHAKIVFIEALLLIKIFEEIGISFKDSAKVIPRMSGYHSLAAS